MVNVNFREDATKSKAPSGRLLVAHEADRTLSAEGRNSPSIFRHNQPFQEEQFGLRERWLQVDDPGDKAAAWFI